MSISIAVATVFGLMALGVAATGVVEQQAAAPPPGITRTELVNNPTVLVARLRMAPGAREDVHTHPFSAVVVQIGEGDVDMRLGDGRDTTRRAHGFVEFIPREMRTRGCQRRAGAVRRGHHRHQARSPPGPRRARLGGAARHQPRELLENAETRVTRVTFASVGA